MNHRMLQVAQVYTYLVAPSSVKFELHKRIAPRGLQHFVVRHGQLAVTRILGRRDDAVLPVGKPRPHLAMRCVQVSPRYGYIPPVKHLAFPVLL